DVRDRPAGHPQPGRGAGRLRGAASRRARLRHPVGPVPASAQRRPCDAGTGGRGARRRGRRGGRRPGRSMTRFLARHELRAAFARSLSRMYGTEVPAYTTLVEVATEVNAETMAR